MVIFLPSTAYEGFQFWPVKLSSKGRFCLPETMPTEILAADELLVTQNFERPALTIMPVDQFVAQPIPEQDWIYYYPFSNIADRNNAHEIKLSDVFMERAWHLHGVKQNLVLVDVDLAARHYCLLWQETAMDTPDKIEQFVKKEKSLIQDPEYFCVL